MINFVRYDVTNGQLEHSNEDFLSEMMSVKDTSEYNTAWLVSDCDYTVGARQRWAFGSKLIDAGLRLHGEGACFENETPRVFAKTMSKMAKSKQGQFILLPESI